MMLIAVGVMVFVIMMNASGRRIEQRRCQRRAHASSPRKRALTGTQATRCWRIIRRFEQNSATGGRCLVTSSATRPAEEEEAAALAQGEQAYGFSCHCATPGMLLSQCQSSP